MTGTALRYTELRKTFLTMALGAVLASGTPSTVWAEAKEVRFAPVDSRALAYLPLYAALQHKLIEKHAKKAGLGEVKASAIRVAGGAAGNDALLSGNADFVMAGITPLLKIWDKTKGNVDVKATMAVCEMPTKFITNDPRVKTPKDWDGIKDHKIALPAVRVSIQAMFLQMEAERIFGKGQHTRFDSLTVSMPHPQALAALFSGKSEVKSHGATLPYSAQEIQAKDKGLRSVLSSYDVAGPHTLVVMYTTGNWRKENPKLFKAVYDAHIEAFEWVNADLKRAAKLFRDFTESKIDLAELEKIVSDKNEVFYDPAPRSTKKIADFLHRTDQIKNKPESWKDYMWDIAHGLNGS